MSSLIARKMTSIPWTPSRCTAVQPCKYSNTCTIYTTRPMKLHFLIRLSVAWGLSWQAAMDRRRIIIQAIEVLHEPLRSLVCLRIHLWPKRQSPAEFAIGVLEQLKEHLWQHHEGFMSCCQPASAGQQIIAAQVSSPQICPVSGLPWCH